MSIKYGQFCPISKAAEILGERWTLLILRELLLGTSRFSDFQRTLSQISPTSLTKRLGQLADYGLVVKKTALGGKRIEYFPTASAKELAPIINDLANWGMRWARGQMTDQELDVELLMYDLCRRLDPNTLPGGTTVLHFAFTGLSQFPRWWIVVEDEKPALCVNAPNHPVDLHIRTDIRTMIEIYAGDLPLSAARKSERLILEGSKVLARSMPQWLPLLASAQVRPAKTG